MGLGSEWLADHAYEIEQSMREDVCGRCRWNRHDGRGFCCGNTYSEHNGCYTAYTDSCSEWQGKE